MNPKIRHHANRPSETFAYRGAEWHRKSLGTTGLMYDGDNVVADLDGSAVSRFYVTPMLDQNLSMTVVGGAQAGIYFYSQDERSSVRTLTDSTGAVVARYDYTAFGEPIPAGATSSTIAPLNRYTYTGRELNAQSGDYYFRYRVYGSGNGAFTARDPLGYVDGGTLYQGYFALFLQLDSWGLNREKQPVSIISRAADLSEGKIRNLAEMIQHVQGLLNYECECLSELEIAGHGNPSGQFIGGTDAEPLKRDKRGRYYEVGGHRVYVKGTAPNEADARGLWATEITASNVAYVGGKFKSSFPWCKDCTLYLSGCNTGLLRGKNTWPQLLADVTGCKVIATMGFTSGTFFGGDITYSTYAGGRWPDWYYDYIDRPDAGDSVYTYPLTGNAFDETYYGSRTRRSRTFYPRGGGPKPIEQPPEEHFWKRPKKEMKRAS